MMTRVSCGLLVFQVFRYTWSSGGKVYRVRSVGVRSTWLPYSLTASMVSPTWRAHTWRAHTYRAYVKLFHFKEMKVKLLGETVYDT